ncbi:MAG: hypothetical protein K2P80_03395 [Beijerinckiaceae bacterium]|nr:hypothetical protein [Beijerinckiaceae bacterium]
MKSTIAISFVLRCLIVIGLLTGGVSAPAMAKSGSPECMTAMQAQPSDAPQKGADNHKLCPFADVCAVSGYYVGPLTIRVETVRHAVLLSGVIVDDVSHDMFAASPPLRPPQS